MNETFAAIRDYLRQHHVTLVAISKTKPAEEIRSVYEEGQRIFGENKVQELTDKYEALPKDIQWHLVGHLQTNKIKFVAPFVSLIHSIDSLKLLEEVNKLAKRNGRTQDVLLQIYIAREETKFGLSFDEARDLLFDKSVSALQNISIKGMMGMSTFTDDPIQVRKEFRSLKVFFEEMKSYRSENFKPEILSMGMSGDYKIAVEEGSNMVRIGSAIFGAR
ncbi:MAG: YggS family pyridoxal phosphate-dependent enzyme [Chitinophagaceae bacterium]|nr:YggS family pyridoxal phosphate-dependent enzyme [Chitinophagaceae bacterium]